MGIREKGRQDPGGARGQAVSRQDRYLPLTGRATAVKPVLQLFGRNFQNGKKKEEEAPKERNFVILSNPGSSMSKIGVSVDP